MKFFIRLFILTGFLWIADTSVKALEPGAPTATLWYEAGESVVFYNEVKVLRSAPDSYFSVWDSDNDDPDGLPESERVRLVESGHSVRVGRFGNEGSGGQSFLNYNWKNGASYSFLVTAAKKKKRMEYSAFFKAPDMDGWYFIATFSTKYSPKPLTSLYSFIEDFERSPASGQRKREAIFSNGWVQSADGSLGALSRAQFVADRKTASLDALAVARGFQVAIGGKTKNISSPLDSFLQWKEKPGAAPPAYFPGAGK